MHRRGFERSLRLGGCFLGTHRRVLNGRHRHLLWAGSMMRSTRFPPPPIATALLKTTAPSIAPINTFHTTTITTTTTTTDNGPTINADADGGLKVDAASTAQATDASNTKGKAKKKRKSAKSKASMTPAMRQWHEFKHAYPSHIILLRIGDFYECFYEDAVDASALLDIALTKRSKTSDIPMAGVPHHALDAYLLRLIGAGRLVAVAEQVEDAAVARERRDVVRREVVRIVTPGTLYEERFLRAKEHNYLAAITPPSRSGAQRDAAAVGLAWLDLSTGDFHMMRSSTSGLAEDVARIHPREVLCTAPMQSALRGGGGARWNSLNLPQQHNQDGGGDDQQPSGAQHRGDVHHVDARALSHPSTSSAQMHVTCVPSESFDEARARTSMLDLYSLERIDELGDFSAIEIQAAGALVEYVRSTQKTQRLPSMLSPKRMSMGSSLVMDEATRRALEVNTSQRHGGKRGSLLGVIDDTRTASGARLLESFLNFPLTSVREIRERHDAVEYFHRMRVETMERVENVLDEVEDVDRCVQRLSMGRGSPADLRQVVDALDHGRTLAKLLVDDQNIPRDKEGFLLRDIRVLEDLGDGTHKDGGLLEAMHTIEDAVVEDPPLSMAQGGFIRVGFDDDLDRLRDLSSSSRSHIKQLEERYRTVSGARVKMKFTHVHGHFIEVPAHTPLEDTELWSDEEGSMHRIQATTQHIRYHTEELTQLEADIRRSHAEAVALENKLFEQLQQSALRHVDKIRCVSAALARMDLFSSLARIAQRRAYVRPHVHEGSELEVTNGRHPIVEALQRDPSAPSPSAAHHFVPNSCLLGNRGKVWLITGPNMGGKSTFLRQNALIAIMAQMGSFVPAECASVGVVDAVFCRVGASDDLAGDRSTFLTEMSETATILGRATARSLVVMDEVGRGTSTHDGLSIAWAVLEHLHDHMGCRTLFATHFKELSRLQDTLPMLECYTTAAEESDGAVTFLHNIVPGVTPKSYGIHVAELAGLPASVTHRARQVLDVVENSTLDEL